MSSEEQKSFGRNLRLRREEAGYHPDEFARLIGIAPRTLQGIELGYQKMGAASRMRADQVLASPKGWNLEEPSSPYAGTGDSVLRHLAELAAGGELDSRIHAVSTALGVERVRAAQIVLSEEIRKAKS